MNLHLWIIPVLCLAGGLLNLVFGRVWNQRIAGLVGMLFVTGAFADALWVASQWSGLTQLPYLEQHAAWIQAGALSIPFGFQLDQLSLVMLLVVTGVGWLIHLYSIGYMKHEGGFYRYFAYLNLFMFFMLTLVLANNYLLMFIGWEGVGFASYLLIGFFFRKDSAAAAGMKAFVVNRVGDFAFLIGLFELFQHFHSFTYTEVFQQIIDAKMPVEAGWTGPLTVIALLFFIGATGKSAQIPLYVWLPDAMEGPTPVSALIHAATMVTAGVYMVARSATIYDRAPNALAVVLAVGALTAFFAATIGLLQRDIKKVLAYSTVSQLGYMFMACGAAVYGAGIFHLMTHAFFKGLLFLGAGSVIHAMNGEQDMWKIRAGAPGGLRKYAPITFFTFLIATCAISGIPFFSGFYSKDKILFDVLNSGHGSTLWWAFGTVAALLTSFYMFRAFFVTFFAGKDGAPAHDRDHGHHPHESPAVMTIPLIVLGVLALAGGYVGIGDRFGHFLDPVFNTGIAPLPQRAVAGEMTVTAISVALALLGLVVAWYFYMVNPEVPESLANSLSGLYKLVYNKYFVDEAYGALLTRPVAWLSRVVLWKGVDQTLVDGAVNGVGHAANGIGEGLRRQISGNIRSYASWISAAAALVLIYVLITGAH